MLINPDLNVNLNYLNFKNGYSADDGAGIMNDKSNLFINHCSFENNIASTYGGAIYSEDYYPDYKNNQQRKLGSFGFKPFESKSSGLVPSKKLIISNSSFIENQAAHGSAVVSLSSEFNISDSNFTNNTFTPDTESIIGISQNCNLSNNTMDHDWDKINENKIYTDTLLFLFNCSSNKARYFREGFTCPSQEDIDNYNKKGYSKIFYKNNDSHYVKFLDFDNLTAGELGFFTVQGDIDVKLSRYNENLYSSPSCLKMLFCCMCGAEEDEPVTCGMVIKNAGIVISILGGIAGLFKFIWDWTQDHEHVLGTYTRVEMPNKAYMGDEIPIKITVTDNDNDKPIKDGEYKVKIDGKEETLSFENGVATKNYIVDSIKSNYDFVIIFLKNEYRKDNSNSYGKNSYYYGSSTYGTTVDFTGKNTVTRLNTNTTNCMPGERIKLRINTSTSDDNIPINDGEYKVKISESAPGTNTTELNLTFKNGFAELDYSIQSTSMGDDLITCAFTGYKSNGSYVYSPSAGSCIVTVNPNERNFYNYLLDCWNRLNSINPIFTSVRDILSSYNNVLRDL
ncbi:MAG: hypothetical protein LBR15_00855 [Methanobrevibacter sp.]|jgi:predicted outer membrane repeat protein|nr:hypothetical protein [Candidatus Methanovirga australis]